MFIVDLYCLMFSLYSSSQDADWSQLQSFKIGRDPLLRKPFFALCKALRKNGFLFIPKLLLSLNVDSVPCLDLNKIVFMLNNVLAVSKGIFFMIDRYVDCLCTWVFAFLAGPLSCFWALHSYELGAASLFTLQLHM
jgi:hypothetical protein